MSESTEKSSISIWRELRKSVYKTLNPRVLAFYTAAVIMVSTLSILIPYTTQVYLSIAAGVTVALLLILSTALSHGVVWLDILFIGGVAALLIALFKRGLLPPSVLQGLGHYALAVSITLTGLYVLLRIRQGTRSRSHAASMKSLGDFFSVSWATLSSELCSCLHPIPILEALAAMAFLPNRVRLGFVIMMITLIHQSHLTYRSYKSRR